MAYTNSGLVAYCKQALLKKTAYMWGGIFRTVTEDYINQVAKMYPAQYPTSRKNKLKNLIGKGCYGVDCVGLVKSYYWGGIGSPNYSGSTDYGVGTMYNAAKTKGKIASFPKTEGLLVMTADFGHVGVYVGNDKVIESTLSGRGDGVVQTNFSAVKWAYWCQCPCITDDTKKTAFASACKTVYQSLGTARKRSSASLSGAEKGRCIKGDYYIATQLITPESSSQKWFRHLDGTYSAITDTNGAKLFKAAGTYIKGKANAVANVRTGAGINSTAVGKLFPGDIVYIVASAGTRTANGLTWVQVVYNGRLCWVDRQWVNM